MLFVNDAGKALLKKLNCEVGGSVPTFLRNLAVETLKSKSRRSEESEIEGCSYRFYAMPIVDKGYVNVYVIDITERRKAQDILKESEAYTAHWSNSRYKELSLRKDRHLIWSAGGRSSVSAFEIKLGVWI